MTFGVSGRRMTLAQVVVRTNVPGSATEPTAVPRSLDPWLDTLETLARKRAGQRAEWEAEARLRAALRDGQTR